MNIDIVNKQVSKKLGLSEKKVALINTFYWQQIKAHIYSYNHTPLNVENLFVLYPDKYILKHTILKYINLIRKTKNSPKYNTNSPKYQNILNDYKKTLRNFLNIRKQNKFTN